MKLCRHDFGNVIAIGISHNNKEELEQEYFSFFNHGATSGDLHWVTETFAYFWSTPQDLERALAQRIIFKMLNMDCSQHKGKKRGLMPEAQKQAKSILATIENEPFLGKGRGENDKPHKIGYLEYMTVDLEWY